jgi:regulator of PEP synthase PpsR (kinase-PPPase family)
VPEAPPPPLLFSLDHPLVVGLTTNSDRLVQIRRNRLLALNQAPETDYVDIEAVNAELAFARRLFADNDWPVIDVTRRSIEETAFAIVKLCNERMDAAAAAGIGEGA